MNFLCHALPYLDQPVMAVATGIPDFLSVIDRKIRARGKMAALHLKADDEVLRDVARGVVAHVEDDRWFHGGETFARMNLEFAVQLRDLLPGDAGFRPSFVGHILIEMLLDANVMEQHAGLADRYYSLFDEVPMQQVSDAVQTIAENRTDKIPATLQRFASTRFLYDYLDDDTLLFRLNQVMARVGLAELPKAVGDWLPSARLEVRRNHTRLLAPDGRSMAYPELA
ncbi:hypothetical protein [Rhodopirellula halodulae]|uniref:hypothetical protein n=1 Tax=Rhodopirellula halodulae TaxID=2894198 RepID=UPI001E392A25|nr:hypothetical protein [Rhodopirellula sp. JC737]MCC9656054.1 hypothetical protein [Rhodopirellula sp. JC737]